MRDALEKSGYALSL